MPNACIVCMILVHPFNMLLSLSQGFKNGDFRTPVIPRHNYQKDSSSLRFHKPFPVFHLLLKKDSHIAAPRIHASTNRTTNPRTYLNGVRTIARIIPISNTMTLNPTRNSFMILLISRTLCGRPKHFPSCPCHLARTPAFHAHD